MGSDCGTYCLGLGPPDPMTSGIGSGVDPRADGRGRA
jgi:hypothetical protein